MPGYCQPPFPRLAPPSGLLQVLTPLGFFTYPMLDFVRCLLPVSAPLRRLQHAQCAMQTPGLCQLRLTVPLPESYKTLLDPHLLLQSEAVPMGACCWHQSAPLTYRRPDESAWGREWGPLCSMLLSPAVQDLQESSFQGSRLNFLPDSPV